MSKTYICEFCNNEHDGTYGSGRFCSKTCRAKYIASKVKHHVCNFNVGKQPKYWQWKCPHCDFIGKTRQKLTEHRHKEHPQFCVEGGWNKGLTIETNNIVKRYSKTIADNFKTGKVVNWWLGKHHKEETRQLLSRKWHWFNTNSGWGKYGWYKGIWCDSSWELAWVMFNLDHNISFTRCKERFEYIINDKKRLYYPDFELSDGTIVEIKGFINKNWEEKLKQFPKDRKLIVLYKKEIKPYLKYAIDTYGRNFTSLYTKK